MVSRPIHHCIPPHGVLTFIMYGHGYRRRSKLSKLSLEWVHYNDAGRPILHHENINQTNLSSLNQDCLRPPMASMRLFWFNCLRFHAGVSCESQEKETDDPIKFTWFNGKPSINWQKSLVKSITRKFFIIIGFIGWLINYPDRMNELLETSSRNKESSPFVFIFQKWNVASADCVEVCRKALFMKGEKNQLLSTSLCAKSVLLMEQI